MSLELKPCPFCGSENIFRFICGLVSSISCRDCGAIGPKKMEWNTRAFTADMQASVEEATKVIREASKPLWRPIEDYDKERCPVVDLWNGSRHTDCWFEKGLGFFPAKADDIACIPKGEENAPRN